MKQIAIYGKGGIGKSTITANLSATLASAGVRVLQIGCDPKQDSTRLLLGGRRIPTVLDYLRISAPGSRKLEDIVHSGFSGVSCVEAGGPEPGVGCAGRGILSAFDLLDRLGIDERGYDIALYDVLGDVVCGGFAVPLRDKYAQLVYIVTSGEFMSLFAGNNILRGVRNYERGVGRLGGIIFNQRGLEYEEERVRRFADAAHLPIVASFPRSGRFIEAEGLGQTIIEAFGQSEFAGLFERLAEHILDNPSPLSAHPLEADQLEAIVLGPGRSGGGAGPEAPATSLMPPAAAGPASSPRVAPQKRYGSKSVQNHEILHGCAFNGAAHALLQITDAATVAHGPQSCAYLSSLGMATCSRRVFDRYGIRPDHSFVPALRSSQMDERIVIFGGNESLASVMRQVAAERPAAIFVVTTCSSGIIGDDARLSISAAGEQIGNTPVVLIQADGNITGDYTRGVIDAMRAAAEELIDPGLSPFDDAVNIVAEKNLASNTENNYRAICELLDAMGLRVNCRFIRNCTTAQVAGFMRGRLNLPACDDAYGREVCDFLIDRYGARFLSSAFPVGSRATTEWLRETASFFGKQAAAEQIVARHAQAYEQAVAQLRPGLAGKRLFVTAQSDSIDWIIETALDLGMEIVKLGVMGALRDDFTTRYEGVAPIEWSYSPQKRQEEMILLKPDLTLTSFPWRGMPERLRFDTLPMCPDVGFFSGLELARRWERLMRLPVREGWRDDL